MINLTELTKTVYASNGNNPEPIEILFNPGAEHVSLQTDLWTMSAWNRDLRSSQSLRRQPQRVCS